MKIDKILYIVIFCLTLSSCNKWLTIEPTDQISEEELYSNADGYYNQVNGVYKAMALPSLYGREMSWGLMDVLAQYYDFTSMRYTAINAYAYGANKYLYSYSLTLSIINKIWEDTYNTIANCNDIIAHAEKVDSSMFVYKEMERTMILGEAYALRAMLHFDMLRTYAPAPVKNNNDAYIPYVKDFPTLIPNKIPNKEVLKNVIEDLEKAKLLTENMDTTRNSMSSVSRRLELGSNAALTRFVEYRGYRLNCFAIKALLARVYLYAGEPEKALKYAEDLINSKLFKFSTTSDFGSYGNVKLYTDVIFALYNNKLVDYYNAINQRDDQFLPLMDYKGIFGKEGEYTTTIVNGEPVVTDLRELRAKQWNYNDEEKAYRSVKANEVKGTLGKEKYCNKMIPMLRLSEMYYIAAECLFPTNKAQAKKYLEDVRNARNAKQIVLGNVDTQEEFNKLILNEMRREMYGEGQLFFFYKRLNLRVETKGGASLALDKEFVLPIPTSNDIN